MKYCHHVLPTRLANEESRSSDTSLLGSWEMECRPWFGEEATVGLRIPPKASWNKGMQQRQKTGRPGWMEGIQDDTKWTKRNVNKKNVQTWRHREIGGWLGVEEASDGTWNGRVMRGAYTGCVQSTHPGIHTPCTSQRFPRQRVHPETGGVLRRGEKPLMS